MYLSTREGIPVLMNEVTCLNLSEGRPDGTVGAVQIGPSILTPQTFSSCPENLEAAIHNRVELKTRPFQPEAGELARLKKLIACAMRDGKTKNYEGLFTKEAILAWARDNPTLQDLKSSKWSEARMQEAITALHAHFGAIEPNFSVKCEALPARGKAPRMLVADGDVGQVMSLLVIKCFEDLLFARFKAHSVKGRPAEIALTEIFKKMRNDNRSRDVVEGDGSAWDTTVSKALRDIVENPILWKITEILYGVAGLPAEWGQKAMALNTAKKFRKKVKGRDPETGLLCREVLINVDAFRRSGHRGTSCLNWWVNWCIWHTVSTGEPELALDPTRRWFPSLHATGRVWLYFVFEGDDSLGLTEGLKPYADDIEAMWKRFGFNMKLKWVAEGQAATVVGWNVYVDAMGPDPDNMVPEPIRGLISSAWSTSTQLKTELAAGKTTSYHSIAASSYVARYYNNAGRFPELASLYRACAVAHMNRFTTLDREASMRIYGEAKTVSAHTALSEADTRACEIKRSDKIINALKLGLSPVESAAFMALEKVGLDDHLVRQIVPVRWLT